jgi:hypothetical protein
MDLMTGKRISATMWNRNFAFAEGDRWFWQILRRSSYAGSATEPFPVHLIQSGEIGR